MTRIPLRPAFLLFMVGTAPARLHPEDDLTFEEHILPILEANCFPCHSTGKRKHSLDVRQRRLLVRGGDSGPAIVPGDAGGSLLWKKVAQGLMPPGERRKLSAGEIERIGRWLDAGAKTKGEEQPIVESEEDFLTPADREHWAFRPLRRPEVPSVEDAGFDDAGGAGGTRRGRTPVDAFVLEKLRAHGLDFSPDAAPRALIRRVYFDLLGLPPTPAEVEEFLNDASPDAYENLIDRLLASPHYGERWGRHWLDAAGYADSDGYTEADSERPDAWRYRDYVIRSFNEDKPYDVFISEQLAGDEIAGYPGCELSAEKVELLTATGYLRDAADGTGQGGVEPRRAQNQVIADTVNIFGSGILGLTLGCAQCHDHRYDPISQRDYHRIRAAFEPALDMTAWKPPAARRISLYTEADRKKAAEVAALVEAKRSERNAKEAEFVRAVVEKVLAAEVVDADRAAARAARDAAAAQRTEEQKKLIEKYPSLNVSGGTLYQYDQPAADKVKALDAEIAQIAATRPPEDFVSALWEEPGRAPPSRLLIRGDPDQAAEEVRPGVLAVLTPPGESFELAPPPAVAQIKTTGRRLALARWLARPDHPLTARVCANRLWMHHFGRGLVPTPGDFGRQGDKPAHPELLDWLAAELVSGGWKLKRVHKLILTSTVYRQSAAGKKEANEADPDNELLWRRPILRLEGEIVRDAMLAASGVLSRRLGGPPVPVKEDADGSVVVGIDKKAESNRPGADVPIGEEEWRRTVYVEVRRSRPLSFTAAFDVPVMQLNCTQRAASNSAPQALVLLNGKFTRRQAELLAARLENEATKEAAATPGADDAARVDLAFRIAFARPPSAAEREKALAFLHGEGANLVDLCHALLNASEFLFIE